MSIAGDCVFWICLARMSYTPVLMNSVKVLLALEAQISRRKGIPIAFRTTVQKAMKHKIL